jgi:SOS-response transcriptional repressor LexA
MVESASLSKVQAKVLAEFERRAREGEAPPSHRDLMAVFGWKSPAAARYQIAALVKKGHLRMKAGETRGAHLPDLSGGQVGKIPLVDRFSKAGRPVKIATNLLLSVTFHTGDPSVAFNAPDSKMKTHSILEGDLVFVRTDLSPKPDDLVGVVVDGSGHVMTFTGARNSGSKPIGVVRQVIRTYSPHDW